MASKAPDTPTRSPVASPMTPSTPTIHTELFSDGVATDVNPFLYDTPVRGPDGRWNTYEAFKLAIASVTLFPVRAVLLLVVVLAIWLTALLSTMGSRSLRDHRVPLSPWRRALQFPLPYLARALLFICGFYWIRETGRPAPSDVAPVIAAASHTGLFEGLLLLWRCKPAVLSTSENKRTPLLGTLLVATQTIWVDRRDPSSRHEAIEQIRQRATHGNLWPATAIFPEGLCTNRKSLVSFKKGAFSTGLPVQPVAIRFPYVHFNFCMLAVGPSTAYLLWRCLCQLVNYMEVTWLPVSMPTAERNAQPERWAEEVRQALADELGVPVTEHTYEDVRLAMAARAAHLPPQAGLVQFASIERLHKLEFAEAERLLQRFVETDIDRSGTVGVNEFAQALGLPQTSAVEHLYDLIDTQHRGRLDFREFLVGMLAVSDACTSRDVVNYAFNVFDTDGDGRISYDEFVKMMLAGFPTMPQSDMAGLFSSIDADKLGYISHREFEDYAYRHPEYVWLLFDVRRANRARAAGAATPTAASAVATAAN